jgi:putative endopeptidase
MPTTMRSPHALDNATHDSGQPRGAAIGALLRRLSERIDRDANRLHAKLGIVFDTRCAALRRTRFQQLAMTSNRVRSLGAATLLLLTFNVANGHAGTPQIGPWGFDLAGMDRTIKPGDDFFRYSGGAWMTNTPIPPDRSSWSTFSMLRAKAETDVKVIVEAVASRPNPPGSIEQKVADYYLSYLDTDAIEKAGLAPIRADLAAMATAHTHVDVARLMGRRDIDVGGPFSLTPWPDAKNPDRYAVNIVQSGLSLPNRDYYLKNDARFVEIRSKHHAYIEALLSMGGYPQAARAANAVAALETSIATLHWSAEKRADRDLTYHPKSRAELIAFAPDFPWLATLSAAQIPRQDFFVVKELDAIGALAHLFRATPVETWRAYMTFQYLNAMADVLPKNLDDLAFDFNGKTLSGQPQKRERWKRATVALNAALGEAVGALYVRKHFTPEAKAQVAALVENLRAAYRTRIARVTWMSEETRQAALRKLDAFRIKIGYPDTWRNYATLEIRSGDPIGNRKRAKTWEWRRRIARLDQPTDRSEWGMTPQTVNAYYNAYFNEIVFPAAILQPPYFDADADPAVNYGGIGGVIGHEMGHAFDDQGSKSDENGIQRTWWKAEDVAHFKKLVATLATQYSQFEPLPGAHLNGTLTLGENIGDNGGLSVALDAYRISLRDTEPPVIDGFSGLQRFFLSWAQTYRENIRDAQLRANLTADPHSPAEFRVNAVVRNMDAWYAAFDVRPGDKLYIAPADRVHIW